MLPRDRESSFSFCFLIFVIRICQVDNCEPCQFARKVCIRSFTGWCVYGRPDHIKLKISTCSLWFLKWNSNIILVDAGRALELLERYYEKLNKPQDRALRTAIERVIRIFQSHLFLALLGMPGLLFVFLSVIFSEKYLIICFEKR